MRKPWWQHEATVAWALILFFPLGVFMMWRYAPWRNRFKWLWTTVAAIAALIIVAGAVGGGETDDSSVHVGTTGSTATNPQTGAIIVPTMTTQELAYVEAVATKEAERTTPRPTAQPIVEPTPRPDPPLAADPYVEPTPMRGMAKEFFDGCWLGGGSTKTCECATNFVFGKYTEEEIASLAGVNADLIDAIGFQIAEACETEWHGAIP